MGAAPSILEARPCAPSPCSLLALSGCAATFADVVPQLVAATAPEVDCPAERLRVSERQEPEDLRPVLHWTARGCGREWACSGNRAVVTCRESEQSRAVSLRQLVVERVALESGCAADQVAVERESEWSRGGDRAYRLAACGKAWICTTSTRGTDCRRAAE